jgi:alpha-tubulin suppressor-like RCC1 family protein
MLNTITLPRQGRRAVAASLCLVSLLLGAPGGNAWAQTKTRTAPAKATPDPTGKPVDVCLGADFALVLDDRGTLWSWGGSLGNSDGQLGLGDDNELDFLAGTSGVFSHFAATRIASGFASVACGPKRAAALTPDGELWAWGQGLIGNGNAELLGAQHRPARIGKGFARVSLGEDFTLAIKTDGSLWAWGNNASGQLGDGTRQARALPVKIGEGYHRISAGYNHAAAIRDDGSLWTWGNNRVGQLGVGEPTAPGSDVPLRVGPGYAEVSVGAGYSVAVTAAGELMAWGSSRHGFGRGVEEDRSNTPVKIGDGFVNVVTDNSHALGLQRDGTVLEWGWRTQGERHLMPAPMGGDFKRIAVQDYGSAGIKNDQTLWLWGGRNWQRLADLGRYPDVFDRTEMFVHEPQRIAFPLAARKPPP